MQPKEIRLDSRRAYRQLVVTGIFNGEQRDLTHSATFGVQGAPGVRVEHGRVTASADGRAVIAVAFGGRTVKVPVTATHQSAPEPIRFKSETLAVLTKQGCAGGSCHGSPHGKGGFSLSLFGFDPVVDRIALTRDGFSRRINPIEPAESLILKKPLLEIAHGGGRRLRKSDTAYQILRNWVAEGTSTDLPDINCDRIEVTPGPSRVLQAPFLKQQLSVTAHFSDGTVRDVTAIAAFESSHPGIAEVSPDGLIAGQGRGQAAISVRYLDRMASFYVTVVRDVPNFVWKPAPENNFVDTLVHRKLRQLQYLPSGDCTDEVFLRRVHLDLTGMLPTAERARQFLAACAAERGAKGAPSPARSKLIDELLATEEFARFWALKKADLMRVSPQRLKEGRAERFSGWLVDAVRTNMPYDRMARELLTATGDTQSVAAANYFLAVPGQEERAEISAQIFLGTRIECAKCHNHPYENWTMRDYYSIAAVFARTQAENGVVRLASSGEVLHPSTKEPMKPWAAAVGEPAADRRTAFADWITKPGNPYFARVEVNRIWAELLGRGIVDPVDDFRASNPPANLELLDRLAREFEQSGYDRKQMIRLICNSRTYQRSTETNRFNETDDRLFSYARVRLLTAEQLKDAIAVATQALAPASTVAPRLADFQKQRDSRAAALESAYPAWLGRTTAQVLAQPVQAGGWYATGSFPTARADALEQELARRAGGGDLTPRRGEPAWTLRPLFRDGTDNDLGEQPNQAAYIYRRLHSTEARAITVETDPRQPVRLWLNGMPVDGGGRQDRRRTLTLRAGENHLLLRGATGPNGGFRFRIADPPLPADLPPHVAEFLALPAPKRTAAQNAMLHSHYQGADEPLRKLRDQIERLDLRLDYATQRPYPEPTTFTAAFGQPLRETACACERQSSPTLLQALELLNGGVAYGAVTNGGRRYAELKNEELIETLYLSALSRQPTQNERRTATQFLEKAADRTTAVTDLVWTVVNTQEFLFQH